MEVLFFARTSASVVRHDKEIVAFAVTIRVVEDALSLLLISTSSTALLNIALQTLRHGIVDYESYVSLVDAHTECDGRNDHLDLVLHPARLDLLAARVRELCVIVVALHLIVPFKYLG